MIWRIFRGVWVMIVWGWGLGSTHAASGMFPKAAPATNVFVFNTSRDARYAIAIASALQGLVNRSSAEVFIGNEQRWVQQLKYCGTPFQSVKSLPGTNGGFRAMFGKYKQSVKKLVIYDPDQDWSWFLALMDAGQNNGIPITDDLRKIVEIEFSWTGKVDDFRGKWPDRITAYDWAMTHLMPKCDKRVLFALQPGKYLTLYDYVVSSGGFVFWLNRQHEGAEAEKIFATSGYGVGTSLMGYPSGGDFANELSNKYGIGYVVSDFYANGSFWSSFPNTQHSRTEGRSIPVKPGKAYVSLMWSDGDNIAFDENPLYDFWHDAARGTFPMATALSPTLQELNPPLLDWYFHKQTASDELMCGPTGVQFIYINCYNAQLFPRWCALTKKWCSDAGLGSVRIWRAPNPSAKYTAYMTTCGFDGVIGEGWSAKPGEPPKIDTFGAENEAKIFEVLSHLKVNPRKPGFINLACTVAGFNRPNGGYTAVKRQIDKAEKTYPGRFIFMLPRDQFASIRAYYGIK